jgi:argininosuccinate lyase
MAAACLAGDRDAALSKYTAEELARIMSARNFVEVRRTPGGPAPEETARALAASRELLEADRLWLDEIRSKVEGADAVRRARAQAL